jgi:hypothetical protein
MMSERQKHGFDYQKLIIEKYNLLDGGVYNGKWDGYDEIGGVKIPVSIKCLNIGSSIELGDFKRQIEIDCDFILYVGFWDGNTNNIIDSYRVLIYYNNWVNYFGDVNILDDMLNDMKTISNDYSDDEKWGNFRLKYNKRYGKSIISLRFKRDHKKQKRIQCGISNKNFHDLILKENKNLLYL